jgi:hypothetical protein
VCDRTLERQTEDFPEGDGRSLREINDTAIESDIERGDAGFLLSFALVVERGNRFQREEINGIEYEVGAGNDVGEISLTQILGNRFDLPE